MYAILKNYNYLLFLVFYIFSIPLFQAYSCESKAAIGYFFLIATFIGLIVNSKKLTFSFVELVFIGLVTALNIYYMYVSFSGLIYIKYTYLILLPLFLSKFFSTISPTKLVKTIGFIYSTIIIFLGLEYLYVLFFGNDFFIEYLSCYAPGVVGYRHMSDYSLFSSFFSTPGLNSILLGSQTASQISLISLIWFFLFSIFVSNNFKNKVLILFSLLFLILSPTITSWFLFLVTLIFAGIFYLRKRTISAVTFYLGVILIISLAIFFAILVYSRYDSLGAIFDRIVLPQVFNFNFLTYKELFLGVNIEKASELFKVTEIAVIHHFAIFGIIGVVVFFAFVFFNIFESMKFRSKLDSNEKLLYFASVAIVFVFVLSNIHYQVMFQVGLMEIFSIHLAYIISILNNQNKLDLK